MKVPAAFTFKCVHGWGRSYLAGLGVCVWGSRWVQKRRRDGWAPLECSGNDVRANAGTLCTNGQPCCLQTAAHISRNQRFFCSWREERRIHLVAAWINGLLKRESKGPVKASRHFFYSKCAAWLQQGWCFCFVFFLQLSANWKVFSDTFGAKRRLVKCRSCFFFFKKRTSRVRGCFFSGGTK